MKEKYIPVEPLKKGVKVTTIAGKGIIEAVRPRVEPKLRRSVVEVLDYLFGAE